jgi:hypothetical protein
VAAATIGAVSREESAPYRYQQRTDGVQRFYEGRPVIYQKSKEPWVFQKNRKSCDKTQNFNKITQSQSHLTGQRFHCSHVEPNTDNIDPGPLAANAGTDPCWNRVAMIPRKRNINFVVGYDLGIFRSTDHAVACCTIAQTRRQSLRCCKLYHDSMMLRKLAVMQWRILFNIVAKIYVAKTRHRRYIIMEYIILFTLRALQK